MKKICFILVFAILASCFSGCDVVKMVVDDGISDETFLARNGEDGFGAAVVVIMGNHANCIKPTSETLDRELGKVFDLAIEYSIDKDKDQYCAEINLQVILSDGNPFLVELYEEDEETELIDLQFSANSPERLDRDVDRAKQKIYDALLSDSLRAKSDGCDLGSAISKAAIILRSSKREEKHLLIFDNGMPTAGYLNMNKLDIQKDSFNEVVQTLDPAGYAELDGVEVRFCGLGNVCGSQVDISVDSVLCRQLEDFWTNYFVTCGANVPEGIFMSQFKGTELIYNENISEGETATEDDISYRFVPNVAFKLAQTPIRLDENGNVQAEEPGEGIIVLNTTSLNFKGDSAVFRDQEEAERTLMMYENTFKQLKDHSITIYVVGSKAKTTPDDDLADHDLSAQRAEAVKKLICDVYGIAPDKVIAIDAGTQEFSWRNAVEFPGGKWSNKDKDAMQKNRVVAIIPSTASLQVAELIEKGELPADAAN